MTSQQKKLKEYAEERLLASKQFAEELNVQLHLGAAEASEEFEKQKADLRRWLQDAEKKLDQAEGISKEKAQELKTSIEKLKIQAALGKAEMSDKWGEQREKLTKEVGNLRQEMSQAQKSFGSFQEEAAEKLGNFQTRFDLFRVQLNLGKAETKELWKEKQKDIAHKLQDVKSKLHQEEKIAGERWDSFSAEMQDAWSHVKKAFKA